MERVHYVQLSVCLSINSLGILLTILSFISVYINSTIDRSFRGILLSFSSANFIGACILIYDTICDIYNGEDTILILPLVRISVILTLTHFMLLLLAEYAILTSPNSKRRLDKFFGLIILSWMISVSTGSLITVTENARGFARVMFAIVFLLALVFISTMFLLLIKKYRLRKNLELFKLNILALNHPRSSALRRYWKLKLKLLAINLTSYFVCSLFWVFNEIYEGTQSKRSHYNSIVLNVYSLNFYFPSVICIYLCYKEYKTNRILPYE